MKRTKRRGLQPIKDLLEVIGCVDTMKISILIDSGATNNFMSRSQAEKIGLDIFEDNKLQVRLADGNQIFSNSYAHCAFRLGSLWTNQRFEILNADISTIFGMPFLEEYNPQIDWTNKVVLVPTKHGVTTIPTIFGTASTIQQSPSKNSSSTTLL